MRTLAFYFLLTLVSCGENLVDPSNAASPPAESSDTSSDDSQESHTSTNESSQSNPASDFNNSQGGPTSANERLPESTSIEPTNSIDELPSIAFRQLLSAGSRLSVRSITGSDGSSLQESFFDSKFQMSCSVQLAADGNKRCLPDQYLNEPSAYFFSDSSCTKPAYFAYNNALDTNTPYKVFVTTTTPPCWTRSVVYLGAKAISTSSLYTNYQFFSTTPSATKFSCGRVDPSSSTLTGPCVFYYTPGASVPSDGFVSFH
jgi:hypothetical protein